MGMLKQLAILAAEAAEPTHPDECKPVCMRCRKPDLETALRYNGGVCDHCIDRENLD